MDGASRWLELGSLPGEEEKDPAHGNMSTDTRPIVAGDGRLRRVPSVKEHISPSPADETKTEKNKVTYLDGSGVGFLSWLAITYHIWQAAPP